MRINIYTDLIKFIIAFTLCLSANNLAAQSAAGSIMEDVVISSDADSVTIKIIFSCAMRYITHYPPKSGNEIQIKLNPLLVCKSDNDAQFNRESITPEHRELAHLIDVVYEGDIDGGPFMNLIFSKPVNFQVTQSPDFRSLTVKLYKQ